MMMTEKYAKEAKKKNIKRRNIRESIHLLVPDLNHKRRESSLVNENAHILIRNQRKEEENIPHLGRNIIKRKNHQRMIDQEREYIRRHLPLSIEGTKRKILSVISI